MAEPVSSLGTPTGVDQTPRGLRPQAQSQRWGLHLSLLALTLASTTVYGVAISMRPGLSVGGAVLSGLGFALTLLAILLSHEMGHYVFARIHRIDTTLPYVIPAPPWIPGLGVVSFGTFGAVIRMRSPIATRDALVDVGASGPIAGAIVALPLLALGLSWSQVIQSPTGDESFWFGHNTLFSLLASGLAHLPGALGHLVTAPPEPAGVLHQAYGDNLLMRGMTRLMFGRLAPGTDIGVHPVAIAAWFGLLVTSLNLFPIGQLDGGHVAYAVLGERGHRQLGRAFSWALLLLACVSSVSWLLWWFVTSRLLGFQHPPLEPTQTGQARLGPLRIAIAVVSVLLFLATFIPVPLDQL